MQSAVLRVAGVDPGIRNVGVCRARLYKDPDCGECRLHVERLQTCDLRPSSPHAVCTELGSLTGQWFRAQERGLAWYVEQNTMPSNPTNHVCSGLFAAAAALDDEMRAVTCQARQRLMRRLAVKFGVDCTSRGYEANKRLAQELGSLLIGSRVTHHEADALFVCLVGVLGDWCMRAPRVLLSSDVAPDVRQTLTCSPSELATLL